ncbi:hypothetical protein LTR17_012608 [Elasticomyces elasticus]|nr:hypothetical protein LTR17_012608 [Elasticomyces elasticus]
MADHLAATYLDRAHDAERIILQLKLELQAACTEVKELKHSAAAEKTTHDGVVFHLECDLAEAREEREGLRKSLAEAQADREAEVAGMWRHIDRIGAEKLVVEDENAAMKKELDRVEAEKNQMGAMYDELKEKVDNLEGDKDFMGAVIVELEKKLKEAGMDKDLLEWENETSKEELEPTTGTEAQRRFRMAQEIQASSPGVPHQDNVRSANDFLAARSGYPHP